MVDHGGMKRSAPRIRLARAADMAAVCELVNFYIDTGTANFRTVRQETDEWLTLWSGLRTAYPWYVAEDADGGGLTGLAYARPWNPRGAYAWTAESTVYVDAARRGAGIGSALYGRLLATLRAQGFRSVVAAVAVPNPGSEALHRAQGFEPAGTLRAVGHKHGAWHDVTYWQCPLAAPEAAAPAAPLPVDAGLHGGSAEST